MPAASTSGGGRLGRGDQGEGDQPTAVEEWRCTHQLSRDSGEAIPAGLDPDSRIISISGPLLAKGRAILAVLQAIDKKPSEHPKDQTTILVKANVVGRVIGKGGETVKEVRSVSGSNNIQVFKPEEDSPEGEAEDNKKTQASEERAVHISGSLNARARAIVGILAKLEDPLISGQSLRSAMAGTDEAAVLDDGWDLPPQGSGRQGGGGAANGPASTGQGPKMQKQTFGQNSEVFGGQNNIPAPPGLTAEVAGNPSPYETNFFAQLNAAQQGSSQLVLVFPRRFVDSLASKGILDRVAERSGAQVRLGHDLPPSDCQTILTGSKMANSLAALYLQEQMVAMRAH